mgnify:CR=1 FL=1
MTNFMRTMYADEVGFEHRRPHMEDPQTVSDNEDDEPMHEAINGDNDNKHDESNDEELDDL